MIANLDTRQHTACLVLDADELSEIVAALYDTLVCHAGEMPLAQSMYERLSAMFSHMMLKHPAGQSKPVSGNPVIPQQQTSPPDKG